jgi:phage terminase small subunit
MAKTTAPCHLHPATTAWFEQVTRDYELEEHHLRLLQLAAEAFDRCQDAREVLARDGMFVEGREGLKPHPAIAIERDCRLAFARLIAQLSLDTEPEVPAAIRHARRSTRPGGWNGKASQQNGT